MFSVELFAGCGGLALGLARAGFQHRCVVDFDLHAEQTLKNNKDAKVPHFKDWPIRSSDVRTLNYSLIGQDIALVAGGPPCQPFSIGGSHSGPEDDRNMWPEAVRAVRELMPKAFLFENVRGLLRPSFKDYLDYIIDHLAWPEFSPRNGELWVDHASRMRWHIARANREPTYRVVCKGVNAADYGAPQRRHRVLILGIRTDVATDWEFPASTHSQIALARSQYVTSEYWDRHALPRTSRKGIFDGKPNAIDDLRSNADVDAGLPWVTVRDAIGDLPVPKENAEPVLGHILHPGARVYPRHTGSQWDEPAKALKAGSHGVPGGENMIALSGGRVRYFTLREMARLQGFPDDFVMPTGWKVPIRQLGNAVPVSVGHAFGEAIKAIVEDKPKSIRVAA